MEEICNFVKPCLFSNLNSDKCGPTGMNWFKPGFFPLISDFDESEISDQFFSIENPIEITNF